MSCGNINNSLMKHGTIWLNNIEMIWTCDQNSITRTDPLSSTIAILSLESDTDLIKY